MSTWQSIETAPKDGQVVILYINSTYVMPGYFRKGWKCLRTDLKFAGEVSHWMPLPEPPK